MSEPPFINRFLIQRYRCVNSCELRLTPLHALVGPNDSGKSTLLRALQAGQSSVTHPSPVFQLEPHDVDRVLEMTWSNSDQLRVAREDRHVLMKWRTQNQVIYHGDGGGGLPEQATRHQGHARVVRLEPDRMRLPSALIPSAQGISLEERGGGLAGVYDALLARKRRAFDSIESDLVRFFPQAESLALLAVSTTHKELAVQLRGHDAPVGARDLSEGLLYFLAFKALPHLDRTPLILVEEPENGLHPARIAEVVRILRDVSHTTQVVMATHSPLVINELEGNEVSVITRDDQGTHATLLSKTPRYDERASVYRNGEIWLAYADGEKEAALLEGRAAP